MVIFLYFFCLKYNGICAKFIAGQIRDKVGWFPASFAEPINSAPSSPATVALKKAGSLTGSPTTSEPLASIQEEGEQTTAAVEKPQPFVPDFTSGSVCGCDNILLLFLAFSKSVSLTDTSKVDETNAMSSTMTTSHSTGLFAGTFAGAFYDFPPTNNEQLSSVKPEMVADHNHHNGICAKELKTTSTKSPLYEMPPENSTLNDLTPMEAARLKEEIALLGIGTALYQWKARNEQEMSFSRGDIIEVLEQGEMRWRGRLQKNRQEN